MYCLNYLISIERIESDVCFSYSNIDRSNVFINFNFEIFVLLLATRIGNIYKTFREIQMFVNTIKIENIKQKMKNSITS